MRQMKNETGNLWGENRTLLTLDFFYLLLDHLIYNFKLPFDLSWIVFILYPFSHFDTVILFYLFLNFLSYIGVELINNAVIVSGGLQKDSFIHIHVHPVILK